MLRYWVLGLCALRMSLFDRVLGSVRRGREPIHLRRLEHGPGPWLMGGWGPHAGGGGRCAQVQKNRRGRPKIHVGT